ncbi:MAG: Mrp/NBP35 family ATP-binding protein [Sulfolobales archaeon]|nr:Mrp/NBP35 family ATP-binding protein [Sulfolobales archaeon]MCX8186116.1 Mrp/NBP35 family ATP-binding protein [Sulfolobales archaeon]
MSERNVQRPYEELNKLLDEKMRSIKYKVAVVSGKGGVGKSFLTASMAVLAAQTGKKVGIVDADVHGPSIPKSLGISNPQITVGPNGIEPVTGPLNIKLISTQLFLPQDDLPLIWRGPLKGRLIAEFLSSVNWGVLDYLFIDLPPGTGDEALSIAQYVKGLTGALIVTIPTSLSKLVVKKAVRFCGELQIPIIGVVENMKEFICPSNNIAYPIFPGNAGKELAEELSINYLGSIPLDPRVSECMDVGVPFVLKYPDSPAAISLKKLASEVMELVEGSS